MSIRMKRVGLFCAGLAVMIGVSLRTQAKDVPAFSVKILSPEEVLGTVWNHFLGAMRSGSDGAVRSECTVAGYQTLLSRLNDREPHPDQWRRWGKGWSQWGAVHWRSVTRNAAYGQLGPKNKEVSITLVLTPKGWKLDQWSPAD